MTDGTEATARARAARARAFLACATEVARLLGIEDDGQGTDPRRARHLAGRSRKPLRESAGLPERFFVPLMAAAVADPDPSFCGWFVEPALYSFGRRRVLAALVEYLRSGTDAERAGALRAWYWAGVPLSADRSPAYAPNGTRDPALDASRGLREAWLEALLRGYGEATDPRLRHQVLYWLPDARESYPSRLHDLLDRTLGLARTDPDADHRRWAARMDRAGSEG
ncbi:hypothetical protein [Streptomyces solicathayae]|uniref:HEAT repeat domain-containing protein n=1 Tax=Streptomyces solicathayae TaxID=3081768 RepID=A0ABZ0LR71_9ACTN|nr:hypothetical protein [Streptomyces sp. HUAS YS2]WOX21298.1 hypothetical protein R2D22_07830 [Streptomyces sp. HUAS YS2]